MLPKTESLEEFQLHKFNHLSENLRHDIGHFNVFRIEDRMLSGTSSPSFIRRDFYKIMLFQGDNVFHYGDRSIPVTGNTLLFFNPQVPYTYDALLPGTRGYFCIFKDEFFKENLRLSLNELPLFASGVKPVFSLSQDEYEEARGLFEKMIREISTDYIYKYELIKNYVSEMMYAAIRLQPSASLLQHPDASSRITSVFMELLERQFPVESTSQRFFLRSPKDFADKLAVHINHLNRAVRKTTGKTTSDHIFERLTGEAKALLKHTNWNIAEISYALGFEDQAHFNNFFKKQTKMNPSAFRTV